MPWDEYHTGPAYHDRMDDQQAIERYRYLLRTAPPDDIERAHEEAFAQLSAEQRAAVLQQLATQVPTSEISGDDPKSLARTATRAEMRAPGTMERTFGSAGVPGLGSMFLSTLAGAFVGSAIGNAMFGDAGSEVGDAAPMLATPAPMLATRAQPVTWVTPGTPASTAVGSTAVASMGATSAGETLAAASADQSPS